ncbi:MAG: outer membrane beta-barrel protein [Bacteroidetes bacterium]|nr:outer membrane beta-barrel protein [Bacteroidota bacterium]
MKARLLLLAVALLMWNVASFAQFEKGQKDLNIGLGLGARFAAGSVTMPPVSVSFEVGINDNISVGGYAGYTSSVQDFSALNYKWKYSYIIIGAKGAYHYPLVDNIDTYGGIMLGYNIANVSLEGSVNLPTPSAGGLTYSGYVGGRYHFGEKFGVFGELGYGISWITAGLTLKL